MSNWTIAVSVLVLHSLSVPMAGEPGAASRPAGAEARRPASLPAVLEVRVGDDYEKALGVLAAAGAEDWSAECGYLVGSLDPDCRVKASYHTLPDGFNFTLSGKAPVGADRKEGPWRVSGMSVSDSKALREHKGETDFEVSAVRFRNGRSELEGLPPTTVYLNMARAEAARRMNRYPEWKPTAPEGRWQCFEGPGGALCLCFQAAGQSEVLTNIRFRRAGTTGPLGPCEVFDLHESTLRRYRALAEKALPAGWSVEAPDRGDLQYFRVCPPPPGKAGKSAMAFRVLPPMPPEEFQKRQAALPALQARQARVRQAMDAAAKGNKASSPSLGWYRLQAEEMAIAWDVGRTPSFQTSLAAVCLWPGEKLCPEEARVVAAVTAVLRRADPLPASRP